MTSRKSWTLLPVLFLCLTLAALVHAGGLARQLSCPVCNIDFSAVSIIDEAGPVCIDGRPVSGRIPPLPECPLCHGVFADTELSAGEVLLLKKIVWSSEYQTLKESDPATRHAALLELLEHSSLETGRAWLRAAWANEEKPQLHDSCLEKSLNSFKDCLSTEKPPTEIRAEVSLKIADILRQLGKFSEARQWLEDMQSRREYQSAWYPMIIRYCLVLIDAANSKPAPLPQGNPLHTAIETGEIDGLSAVAANRTLLSEINAAGFTPLILAIKLNNEPAARILLEHGADPDQTDILGNSALHMAVKIASQSMVELILSRRVRPDPVNSSGDTPLHMAMTAANENLVHILLQAGADVHRRDGRGNTILHLLCSRPGTAREQLLTELINFYSEVNQRNFSDLTALHIAAESGSEKMLQILVNAGARLDARLPDGSTALFFCRTSFIPFLLKLGARIDLTDNSGQTAFVNARLKGDEARIQEFKKTGLFGRKPRVFSVASTSIDIFSAATAANHQAIAEIAAKDRSQINARELSLGETPLHKAVASGNTPTVNTLIALGAEVNANSDFLRTPLHYAASRGNLEMVKALCEAGSNIHSLDARGATPLHDAAAGSHRRVCRYLMELGASDTATDNAGNTPAGYLKD